jgi:hypothetical protein
MSETLGGKAVAVLDAATDGRVQFNKQVEQEGIASILSVPVKLREEVIGVMRIYQEDSKSWILKAGWLPFSVGEIQTRQFRFLCME